MCVRCDNPGWSDEDELNHMRALMHRHGWAVQGIEGDRGQRPWAYTVGLTEAGLPELVITGLDLGESAATLNTYARRMLGTGAPAPGTRLTLEVGLDVEILLVVRPWEHLYTAVDMFGPDIRALQLAWSDDAGRWPWERGFGSRQVLLGRRTPPR